MKQILPSVPIFLLFILTGCSVNQPIRECDWFVAWVAPAKDAYQEAHRVYPVPEEIQALARRFMPRLWVYPTSWHPISFEEYLAHSKLLRKSDGEVLMISPSAQEIAALSRKNNVARISMRLKFLRVIRHHCIFRCSAIRIRLIRMRSGRILSIIRSLIGAAWRDGLAW